MSKDDNSFIIDFIYSVLARIQNHRCTSKCDPLGSDKTASGDYFLDCWDMPVFYDNPDPGRKIVD